MGHLTEVGRVRQAAAAAAKKGKSHVFMRRGFLQLQSPRTPRESAERKI